MNPMKFCSGKNRKPEECTNIGFCDSKITLGSSSSTMEYCVICSRKVFVVNHDSLPWADVKLENWVPKAEVTSRFLKSLDKVCRLLADTGEGGKLSTCILVLKYNLNLTHVFII